MLEGRRNLEINDQREIVRPPHLAEKIVFVDGIPGCGKTMMAPIVGGLARVELVQYSYQVEYICSLQFLGKIDDAAAAALIRMFTDLQLYNSMMSRETNFRVSDLSGVRLNPRSWKYLLRLFLPGDAVVLDRIHQERPILNLVTHCLLPISLPIFAALNDRVRIIEVERHPLYMLKQQFKYMPRYGTDVRDFNIWFNHEGQTLPWFANGWEKKFFESCPMNQAIYLMDEMHRLMENVLSKLTEQQKTQVLFIPFERFVTDPWPFMERLESFLDTKVTNTTRRVMKQQKVPRKMYSEGIDLRIYKKYGWEPPKEGADEAEEFERRRQFAAEHATVEAMDVLDRLCNDYEGKYLDGPP